jgi:3-hydroxyacyl-[acyl-carrier-protein] dehydratase
MTASPLDGAVTVLAEDADRVVTTYPVRPDETVLAGHYPGFPILPGVCLLECAHRSAVLAASRRGFDAELVAIEKCRFLAPCLPGGEVHVELSIADAPGGWRCTASVACRGEPLATARLSYRLTVPVRAEPA